MSRSCFHGEALARFLDEVVENHADMAGAAIAEKVRPLVPLRRRGGGGGGGGRGAHAIRGVAAACPDERRRQGGQGTGPFVVVVDLAEGGSLFGGIGLSEHLLHEGFDAWGPGLKVHRYTFAQRTIASLMALAICLSLGRDRKSV